MILANDANAAGQRQSRAEKPVAINAAAVAVAKRQRALALIERVVAVNIVAGLAGNDFDLTVAREQVKAANGRLSLAQQEYSQAQERFKAGVSGNADVVTAALALNTARNGVIEAVTAYETARVELARAEGVATQLP